MCCCLSRWRRGSAPAAEAPMARRKVTDEERALLAHAMRSVRPLKKTKGRAAPPKAAAKSPAKPALKPAAGVSSSKSRPVAPKTKSPAHKSNLQVIDRCTDQKLRRGKVEIDATLDLHGMTQGRAQARLISFLMRASEEGHRTILVITGKGAPRADAQGAILQTGRGVLREAVPRWLEEAPLRDLVWGMRAAGPRQGGQGALYVLLKRPRPSRE